MYNSERQGLLISISGSLAVGIVGLLFTVLTKSQAILLDGLFNITYFIIGLFTMKVARLVLQGDDEHFPVGYSFFEPLINGIKGMLILGISLMALWGAFVSLFSGGRTIAAGLAMLYGALASAICWIIALLLKHKVKHCTSPLLKADADGWIVNAAISTAAFAAFVGMWALQFTPYTALIPYVDPALVILVGIITLSVPVRMAWNALMELVNRSPSADVRNSIGECVKTVLADVPCANIAVRVLQPGRTRIVAVHVTLDSDSSMTLEQMDTLRAAGNKALTQLHSTTQLDILFTKDLQWGAPLNA